MKKKILNIIKKPFVRNVIILSSGTAGAQIVGMALSPFITRLYGPEAYGIMGTFATIVNMIAPISALTFPIAIVLPKSDSEAKGLIRLSLLVSTIISIIVGILLWLFSQSIVHLFQLEDVESYLYLIPIVLLSIGLLQVLEQWLIRINRFSVSAKATFLQAIIVNGGNVGVGIFYPVASVLIFFTSLKHGLKALLMFILDRESNSKQSSAEHEKNYSIVKLIKKYKDFPLYRAPQSIVNSISEGIPVLMLASFFGAASVGFYNIGRIVLNTPTQLIGKSIGDVFYPKISKTANDGINITIILKKATLVLIGVGIIPYGLIILFGPAIFSFVFGSEWIIAGEYARWIALWSYSSFILQPTVRALPVLLAQRFHLIYTLFSLIIRITMLGLGYFLFSSDIMTIGLFGVSSGILNVLLIFITFVISKRFDHRHAVR